MITSAPPRTGELLMTAQETLLRGRVPLLALSALLMGGACGGDKKHDSHADKDAGMQTMDAGDGDGDGDVNTKPDAGSGDGDSGPVGPETCGPTDKICGGTTPACVNGECVECSSDDSSQCAANEGCDPTTHTCVRNAPFALDCADLPNDGACHGGPREVLLVQDAAGYILMFDPQDGHYLGVFKRPLEAYDGNYHQATQGPDQCIWTTQDNRGVERWDTDGSFKDQLIAPAKYYEGQDDIVVQPHGIAFTKDYAYVGFADGNPHDRIVRFKLAGLSADTTGTYEVVLDDGTSVDSLIVLGDETLIVTNDNRVESRTPDGSKVTPVLTGLTSFFGATQVSYAGGGQILTAGSYGGSVYKVELASGKAQEVVPFAGSDLNIQGVAALGNGKWLYADRDGTLEALDPASKNPTGQHKSLLNNPAIGARTFYYTGRACLSNEFVAAASQADPPAASCDQPAGEVVVSEDFEAGTLNGFEEVKATGVTVSVDATQGVEASGHSLKIAGGTNVGSGDLSGVHYALPMGTKPSYIGYYVRVDRETSAAGYFSLNQWPGSLDAVYLEDKAVQTFNASGKTTIANNAWVQIQLRDIDWTHMTYDLYVNCTRVMDDISFSPGSANGADEIDLFNLPSNFENTPEVTSWYDKIVILK
jgi:hypothetical protein